MEYEHDSFTEALQILAERAGVELPKSSIPKRQRKDQI